MIPVMFARYKTNIQKSVSFLNTNKRQSERKIKKIDPFKIK